MAQAHSSKTQARHASLSRQEQVLAYAAIAVLVAAIAFTWGAFLMDA